MNDIARRLDNLKRSWADQPGISETLALMGLTDINKQRVTDVLADLSRMAAEISGATPEGMATTHRSCDEMIQISESYLTEYLKDRDAIHMLDFLTLLKQIRLTLAGVSAQHARASAGNRRGKAKAA